MDEYEIFLIFSDGETKHFTKLSREAAKNYQDIATKYNNPPNALIRRRYIGNWEVVDKL